MGLDITAYSGIAKLDITQRDRLGDPTQECFKAYVNPDFPNRADELENGAYYSYKDCVDFGAGSYGGYSQWRNELARMAGYPLEKINIGLREFHTYCAACWSGQQGTFCELINFSDAEGIIGTSVSAKLAKDFSEFQERAASFDWQHPHFKELYQQWREAFELASDNGAVRFH